MAEKKLATAQTFQKELSPRSIYCVHWLSLRPTSFQAKLKVFLEEYWRSLIYWLISIIVCLR